MSTYFFLDPLEFPYYFYRIRGELLYVSLVLSTGIQTDPEENM